MKNAKKDMYLYLDSCYNGEIILMKTVTNKLNEASGRATFSGTYLRYLREYRNRPDVSIINVGKLTSKYVIRRFNDEQKISM